MYVYSNNIKFMLHHLRPNKFYITLKQIFGSSVSQILKNTSYKILKSIVFKEKSVLRRKVKVIKHFACKDKIKVEYSLETQRSQKS